jgi:hypothetical protein
LEATREYPSDEWFVYQIRFQRLVEKTTYAYVQIRGMKHEENSPLIGLYVRALKAQLADLKSKIPSYLAGHGTYHPAGGSMSSNPY